MIRKIDVENRVESLILEITGIGIEELKLQNRRKRYSEARSALSYILRGLGWSYPEIGELINRDHTTVIYNVKSFIKNPYRSTIDDKALIMFGESYTPFPQD